MKIYSDKELRQELNHLHGWIVKDEAIEKSYTLSDFKQALGFIVQIGMLAEHANHHPEIFNVYTNVVIRLNTHSEKAITEKDISLAKEIDLIKI